MERELWPLLYHELRAVATDFSQKYVQIPAWVLLAVSLWAALQGPLPAWTRRLHRVRVWVWAKLLSNAVRILKKQGLMSSLQ